MDLTRAQQLTLSVWAFRLITVLLGAAILFIADQSYWPWWVNSSSSIAKTLSGAMLVFAAALSFGIAAVIENGIRLFRLNPEMIWPLMRGFVISKIAIGVVIAIKFPDTLFVLGIAITVVALAILVGLNRMWITRS